MLHVCSGKFIDETIIRSNCQVFFVSGAMVTMVQLGMLPGLMKVLGITYLQRIDRVAGVLAFTSVPFATVLSRNDMSFYVVSSVTSTFFVCCNTAAVRFLMAQTRYIVMVVAVVVVLEDGNDELDVIDIIT